MPAITPAYQVVNPSYIMPEMILSYQQASGAFSVMASGNPLVRLSEGSIRLHETPGYSYR